jgi:hypothetical protein
LPFTEIRRIAMPNRSIGACLTGAVILLGLTAATSMTARADDTAQNEQLLQARCVKQGQLGKSAEELTSNCGCLAKVGARHLRPTWRQALLSGGSQGSGAPMDDQTQFETDAEQSCPAIVPYAPKPGSQ